MKTYYDDIKCVNSLNLPWDVLDHANILITGASGLIGRTLVDVLMQLPNRKFKVFAGVRDLVYAQDCFVNYQNDVSFKILQYDVTEVMTFDIDFHYIIHAASHATPKTFGVDPVGVMKTNICGVDNLLSYGIGHHLKRFLYLSSGEVYGEGSGESFREEDSGYLNCVSLRACYPSAKRAAETLCISYASQYKIEAVIARPCHIYGPNFTPKDNRAYAQFIHNILAGDDIVLKSSGMQYRSWCYVVDCAFALLYILLNGENENAYNIADEYSNASIRDFAEMIALKGKRKVIFELSDEVKKNNIISRATFCTEKIKKTGWYPRWCLEEGISHTLNTLN